MMKTTFWFLSCVGALFVWMASGQALEAIEIGEKMKALEHPLKTTEGRMTSLSKVRGSSGTLVIFTCNHCPYVKKWQDRLTTLGNAYSSKEKKFGVIAVNANDPAVYEEDSLEQMKLLKEGKLPQSKLKMNFIYAMDETSKVARELGALKTPEFFLFNSKDELVYRGALDGDADNPETTEQFLKVALDKTFSGKKLTASESKTEAFGCSIKFRR